jgi:hypothetical protein
MPLPREHLLDELATAYVQTLAALAGATIAVAGEIMVLMGRSLKLRKYGPLKGCNSFLRDFPWTFS